MAGQNYVRGYAMGNNQYPITTAPPPIKAVTQYVSENATASSVITLTENTTAVEIATGGTIAYMRWVRVTDGSGANTSVIAVAGATANLDHVIPPNAVRRFVVPIEVNNPQGYSSQVGANIENGLFRRLAYKTGGVASVLVTEYANANF